MWSLLAAVLLISAVNTRRHNNSGGQRLPRSQRQELSYRVTVSDIADPSHTKNHSYLAVSATVLSEAKLPRKDRVFEIERWPDSKD
jgi:hypothetical protein